MKCNLVSINVPVQQYDGKFQDFLIVVILPFIFHVKSDLKRIAIPTQVYRFSNVLELKPIIQRMNNKVRKALYSNKGFLYNPHIPLPYKGMLFSAIVIGQVFQYYATLLGSNKERVRSTQTLVNSERIILDCRIFKWEQQYFSLLCF